MGKELEAEKAAKAATQGDLSAEKSSHDITKLNLGTLQGQLAAEKAKLEAVQAKLGSEKAKLKKIWPNCQLRRRNIMLPNWNWRRLTSHFGKSSECNVINNVFSNFYFF